MTKLTADTRPTRNPTNPSGVDAHGKATEPDVRHIACPEQSGCYEIISRDEHAISVVFDRTTYPEDTDSV
jgi:hypothetical protein